MVARAWSLSGFAAIAIATVTCLLLSVIITPPVHQPIFSGASIYPVPHRSGVTSSPEPAPQRFPSTTVSGRSAAPSLSSGGQSPAAIGLSWTDTTSGTFTNYSVLEASQSSGWTYSTAAVITSASTTTYVASGLSPGTQYAWQIVENYETCVLLICSSNSQSTNVLNLTQPTVAFLNASSITSTSATLNWTNNATYGALISFLSYSIWKEVNASPPAQLASITTVATTAYTASLVAGASYSFFVVTADCIGGCGGSSPTASSTQSNLITIGTPQTLSVTVFAEHTVIDLGQSDFFTCTPTGGKSPFTYAWDFANGTLVSGIGSESDTLPATGVLSIKCQITDSEPSTASATVLVQVNPPLEVTVSKNRSAADVGQVVAFACSAVNGTTPYSLYWNFGDGATSTLSSPSHSYTLPGNYAPTCVVADSAGVGVAPSFPLVVSPSLAVSASASAAAVAPGTPVSFTAHPANGSGTYTSYTWSFGPGVTASGVQVNHTFTAAQDSPITVAVSDSNGAMASGSVVVDVSSIFVTVSTSSTTVTSGGALTFSAAASGGSGGPFNFTWTFGDGSHGYGASVTHTYSATGTVTPTLVVRDRLGAVHTSPPSPLPPRQRPSPGSRRGMQSPWSSSLVCSSR
jgi:PKD domain-containing protein